jgi:hypothetical protein
MAATEEAKATSAGELPVLAEFESARAAIARVRDYATSLPEHHQPGYGLGRIRDDLLGLLREDGDG